MRLRGPGMNRNAIGAAVLGLALAGAGTSSPSRSRRGGRRNGASPPGTASTSGRARHDGLRRGRAFAVRRVSTVVPASSSSAPQRSSGTSVRAVTSSACFPPERGFRSGTAATLPYLGLGRGFGWTDLDDEVFELSRRFNFRIEGSVGVRILRRRDCAWTLEARYQHISNAGTSFPNLGLNALVFLGRLRFSLKLATNEDLTSAGGIRPPRIRGQDGRRRCCRRRRRRRSCRRPRRPDSAAATGAAPAPSATTRARAARWRMAAAVSASETTSDPARSALASGHISGSTLRAPMPSTKLGV